MPRLQFDGFNAFFTVSTNAANALCKRIVTLPLQLKDWNVAIWHEKLSHVSCWNDFVSCSLHHDHPRVLGVARTRRVVDPKFCFGCQLYPYIQMTTSQPRLTYGQCERRASLLPTRSGHPQTNQKPILQKVPELNNISNWGQFHAEQLAKAMQYRMSYPTIRFERKAAGPSITILLARFKNG